MDRTDTRPRDKHRINAFDVMVLAGGLVNVIVVVLLFGYWLTH